MDTQEKKDLIPSQEMRVVKDFHQLPHVREAVSFSIVAIRSSGRLLETVSRARPSQDYNLVKFAWFGYGGEAGSNDSQGLRAQTRQWPIQQLELESARQSSPANRDVRC